MAKRPITTWLALLAGAAAAGGAFASDYRSVDAPTVLYDAPSQKGKPLFVIRRFTPVEPVVNLEGWAKVRDADGGLAWIEKKYLVDRHMLQVTVDRAQVRRDAEDSAGLVFEAEKGVALEFVEAGPPGWAKVRHRDGQSGYVRVSQVWGL